MLGWPKIANPRGLTPRCKVCPKPGSIWVTSLPTTPSVVSTNVKWQRSTMGASTTAREPRYNIVFAPQSILYFIGKIWHRVLSEPLQSYVEAFFTPDNVPICDYDNMVSAFTTRGSLFYCIKINSQWKILIQTVFILPLFPHDSAKIYGGTHNSVSAFPFQKKHHQTYDNTIEPQERRVRPIRDVVAPFPPGPLLRKICKILNGDLLMVCNIFLRLSVWPAYPGSHF